jgi:hypothetical protein
MAISVRLERRNARASIRAQREFGSNVTEDREAHPQKQSAPMLSTTAGMTISAIDEPANARASNRDVWQPGSKTTRTSDVQPEKQSGSSDVGMRRCAIGSPKRATVAIGANDTTGVNPSDEIFVPSEKALAQTDSIREESTTFASDDRAKACALISVRTDSGSTTTPAR